jgi:hypothetical protein
VSYALTSKCPHRNTNALIPLGYTTRYVMANEIISYLEMCGREGTSLQRGMNFALRDEHSVLLDSQRPHRVLASEPQGRQRSEHGVMVF